MTNRPVHVGLIPDGLRRWAKANNTTLGEAYLRGAKKVVEILVALQRNDVQTVTVYNLSKANLGRTVVELEAVYSASIAFFTTLIPYAFDPERCGFRLHGDVAALPPHYAAAGRHLETKMTGTEFQINILAAYDAYDEIRNAAQRAERDGSDLADALDIGEVDLVIRTTAEPLLSGFCPLQSQYAQLFFLTTPLNDLTIEHLDDVLAQYRRSPQLRGR